ncbi:GNAT family N-acetyltransferase [Jeotgalibacillus soli]|uniref:N-acetyltransferase n=1 Tax=Jeotgalibacillus soli TaxID=889306 RepID=A0A0C2VA85_9BACL|nr:GNAT family N-acetyltransferase [Jeotgalibacillus soli]KIL45887.1 N-acetyltransferase [Jeotgalibacillus soli]
MKKEFYTFKKEQPKKTIIRNYTLADADPLIQIQREAFPPPFPEELLWNHDQLEAHTTLFPEGALCVEVEGEIAGSMTALRVNLQPGEKHTWNEITDQGYIRNHQPNGSSIYVVDICVSPRFRGLGLGKELMLAMYETVVYLGADRLVGGSRIPGYQKVKEKMSPEEYVSAVKNGTLQDPVVTFLMKCGRVPVELLPGYLDDEESNNNAVLMEWKNPFKG